MMMGSLILISSFNYSMIIIKENKRRVMIIMKIQVKDKKINRRAGKNLEKEEIKKNKIIIKRIL